MQAPGDPREHYIARLDGSTRTPLAIQQLNRLQNRHDLLRGDARTGASRRSFATSPRPGSTFRRRPLDRRQPRVSRGSANATDGDTCIASGATAANPRWSRRSTPTSFAVVGVDEARGLALRARVARQRDAGTISIVSRLDGTGSPERVTPAELSGTHGYVLSPDASLRSIRIRASISHRRPTSSICRPSLAAHAHRYDGADAKLAPV